MNNRVDVVNGFDEVGLETPFAENLDAAQEFDASTPLGEFGEMPFASASETEWSESFADEAFSPGEMAHAAAVESTSESEAGALSESPDAAKLVSGPTLRRGSSGEAVAALQRCLGMLGHRISINGRYEPATETAVRAFQTRSGLSADGVAGPRTRAAIAAALRAGGPSVPTAAVPASGNRIIIERHPLIQGHRGTAPDLILKWNRINGASEVDVVVHFHGYSGLKDAMRIDRDKERHSGLDFSDPAGSGATGRSRPTIAILPRGNYFGGKSGAGYDFPNLIRPGALQQLIDDSLARLGQHVDRSFSISRCILTGHSGGGAPVTAILAHMDPDEVHIFDGMYGSGHNIVEWAKRRMARELTTPGALPPALRILYRQGSAKYPGTQPNSEAIARELRGPLGASAAAGLRPFFRVDKTAVEHNDIPARFGWLLLANAGADLPRVSTYGTANKSNETYEQPEVHAAWESAPTLREESERETINMSEQQQLFEPEENFADSGERSDSNESLAWLDVESPSLEAEWFEHPAAKASEDEGFEGEGLESSQEFEPGVAEWGQGEEGESQYRDEAWSEMEVDEAAGYLERFGEFEDERDTEWLSAELEEELEEESSLISSGLTPAEQKAVEITSTFETGKRGGFFGLSGNFDGQGLSFGLVNWTVGTGSLQPLLRDFAAEQPQRWASAFGPDAERFRRVIAGTSKTDIKEQHRFAVQEMNASSVVKGKTRWAIREPWVTYFRRLSEDPEFQKIQVRYVRDLLLRAEYYCRYFKLTSEQSFAFMFDAVSSHGKRWLTKNFSGQEKRRVLIEQRIKALDDRHGQDRVPESEILLAIADVLGATSAQRWAAMVRQRKRWFVTGEHPRAKELRGLEPRQDVPYTTSAGTPVAPAPRIQPQQPPDLGARIAQIAEQECRRWHPPAGNIYETHRAAVPILQQYYREGVGVTVSADNLQSKRWHEDNPWSAVFVSWVMRTADPRFPRATAHWKYVSAARKNRLDGVTSNPFWAYRATEAAPQMGDIIVKAREGSGLTYDTVDKGGFTHGDIVTEVHPGFLRVIGGNVNQNVAAKKIVTLPDGRVSLQGKQSVYFAVVRCRGPIGAQPGPTPSINPAPAPSAPMPPSPSSSPKKLTPARFVATYGGSARASQAKNGVPALVTLGQAALESGWGAHAPRFNFFGIKARASDAQSTRQLLKTREVFSDPNRKFPKVLSVTRRPDGRYDYVVCDWFRAYPDPAKAFDAHGEFLVRNKRYANAFKVANDPYAFAAEVARAGYATDPKYERVLANVMRTIEAAGGG